MARAQRQDEGGLGGLVLAGAAWAALEAAGAVLHPHPLDPPVRVAHAAMVLLGLPVLLASTALVLRGALGRRATVASWVLWASVWAPHAGRVAGLEPAWGWGVVVGLAAVGWWAPRGALALGLAGALALPLCRLAKSSPGEPATVGDGLPDIVLVSVDTVRADAGLFDGLDGAWVRYTGAIAAAPWTPPAMHSLMVGLDLRDHGGGIEGGGGISVAAEGEPLARRLAALGYRTSAWVSNPHLRREYGFAEGFVAFHHSDDAVEPLLAVHTWTRWRERATGRPSPLRHERDERLVAAAEAELLGTEPWPRFVWVHLLGPHEYARDPAEHVEGWAPGTTNGDVLRRAYAINVAAAARHVERLSRAAGDAAVVAVVGDHGERLGPESWGHGLGLDDAELRVPLAVRAPGMGAGQRGGQVATRDLGGLLLCLATGCGQTGLPERARVEVGGVRRDPEVFAARKPDGHYEQREPGRIGPLVVPGADAVEALEALGYTGE